MKQRGPLVRVRPGALCHEHAPRTATLIASLLMLVLASGAARAFCGFYVARADTSLYNEASQVVIMRDEERTVLTMSNDFKGEVQDFAMVIPVPSVLQREQIHVTERAIIEHLDAYTAPRLVEYFDPDPCRVRIEKRMMMDAVPGNTMAAAPDAARANSLGVKIEASYTVGEYDILILSAEQSEGLITWLSENGYRIPAGANDVVRSYLARDMKFFVARVNLQQQSALGYTYLRPIQIAFESPRFMLPIRLGMVNAAGPQELFIYALTRTGRVETTNYRTVKLPSGNEIPAYVKSQFARFYKAMFERQTESESGRAVFLEYAWDMNWCDPCAADPLSPDELRELGVYWLSPEPAEQPIRPLRRGPRQARDVYVTRLHVRYDKAHFPEDLMFQQTGNRQNFQGRYVIRHPYKGPASCEQAREYFERTLPERLAREAATLANLTGWSMESIRPNLDLPVKPPAGEEQPWWKELWK